MDLHVEKQSVEQLAGGDKRQFLLLFDASFSNLYRYVRRRVENIVEVERIVRFTFLDAFSQSKNAPTDVAFSVWLYSLARQRVWNYLNNLDVNRVVFAVICEPKSPADEDILVSADLMFSKMSLEENEIMKLKFLEEVSDGDVMTVLNSDQENIGSRIYRVFKRAHLLFFGDGGEKGEVYFGELSAAMESLREMEEVNVPEALKLSFRAEISMKIDSNDFAVDAEIVEEDSKQTEKDRIRESLLKNVKEGASDPAKVFVKAAQNLNSEEREAKYTEHKSNLIFEEKMKERKDQKREEFLEAFDAFKRILLVVPLVIFFIVIATFAFIKFDPFSLFGSGCKIAVKYEGNIDSNDKLGINKYINDRLCEHFEVEDLLVQRVADQVLDVDVIVSDWNLEYEFDTRGTDKWYIQKFKKSSRLLRNS